MAGPRAEARAAGTGSWTWIAETRAGQLSPYPPPKKPLHESEIGAAGAGTDGGNYRRPEDLDPAALDMDGK
jgi:hypothetical protein